MTAASSGEMTMNRAKYSVRPVFFLALLGIAMLFCGCDAGSNGPITSDLSTGEGYKIKLASSVASVKVGGKATLTAVIFEPDGSPIRDDEDVYFSSSENGALSDDSVKTLGGTAVVTYTAGEHAMRFDTITASCHGAISSVQVDIVPENF